MNGFIQDTDLLERHATAMIQVHQALADIRLVSDLLALADGTIAINGTTCSGTLGTASRILDGAITDLEKAFDPKLL